MNSWSLVYDRWEPAQQGLREALCTLGNGYFCTRGAAEEALADDVDYPGTYLAGGYDRLESEIAGRVIENENLVNWPNWLCMTYRVGDGPWFHLSGVDIDEYRQELDLRRGILQRRVRFRDADGRDTTIASERFVHMGKPHLAAIRWSITAHGWSGPVEVRSALDGAVSNQGVARYRDLGGQHLDITGTGRIGEDGVWLAVKTRQSQLRMAQAARCRVVGGGGDAVLTRRPVEMPVRRYPFESDGMVGDLIAFEVDSEHEVALEKIVAIYTSRDAAISEPVHEACRTVRDARDFDSLRASHERSWGRLWDRGDIDLGDSSEAQGVLRLHIFHLGQTISPNSIDLDVGVPARGWHGEAYRGHVFWDELFIFPFVNLRLPELTRELLMYRYRRLPEARRLAWGAGFEGALYPWQSGSNGREESQVVHLNPESGRWLPDDTHLQRHVNAAIAYNVWQYYQVTGDTEFLGFYGAEMLLEIARFWSSIAHFDHERERYVIRGVVGPDEYHTRYPDADEAGLDNNAYTNVMAVWCLRTAHRALEEVGEFRRRELMEALHLDDDDLVRWEDIRHRMYVPISDGVILQFEGYDELEELDWDGLRERHGDIARLDRILEAEGDDPNRYKAGKQADVLMLFFLFSTEELDELFAELDYPFEPEMIRTNIEYYTERTSHGSTLSNVVHAWVLSRLDRPESWTYFVEALESDVCDVQGGTTAEGIHLGAMAGSVDLAQRCYPGITVHGDVLRFNPRLPEPMSSLHERIHYRGHWLDVHITHDCLTISSHAARSRRPVRVGIGDDIHTLASGESRTFYL